MRIPIRWKMMAVVCFSIVLFFCVFMGVVRYVLQENFENRAEHRAAVAVEVFSQNVYQTLERADAVVLMLANYPELMDLTPEQQHRMLANVHADFPAYELLAVVDLQGMQVACSSGRNGNRSNREWYQNFIASGRGGISSVHYSFTTQNLVVTFTKGVYDKKTQAPKAMVVANLCVKSIQHMIRNINSQGDQKIYLLDRKGVAIAHPGDEPNVFMYNYLAKTKKVIRGTGDGRVLRLDDDNLMIKNRDFEVSNSLQNLMHLAISKLRGSTEYTDEKGDRYLCAYRSVPLPNTDDVWTLIVMIPYKDVMESVDGIFYKTLAAGLVILFVTILLVLKFSQSITKSLSNLSILAKRVGRGDYTGEVEVLTNDELGSLEQTFNDMLRQLSRLRKEKHEKDLAIEALANHDGLTGLMNRRSFIEYAESELQRMLSIHQPSALLFIDLDHFKEVNDTYGHATGDALLIAVAKRLLTIGGAVENVCRYGGDEFLMLLPGANAEEAKEKAEQVAQVLRQMFVLGNRRVKISGSVGICVAEDASVTFEEILQQADNAMYVRKNSGKDGVSFAGGGNVNEQ